MNHSQNEQLMARKAAATPRGVGVMAQLLRRARRGRRALGRRGPALHRLRRRHRGDEHRPRPPEGAGGASQAQLERFTHTCYQVVPYEGYIALAEKLNQLTPGTHAKKTALFSTGAEAIENAIKIARAHTRRGGVIAFGGAFHGRSLFAVALTGKVQPYKAGFGPFPPEIYHAPFPCHCASLDEVKKARAAPVQGRHRAEPRRGHRLRAGAGRRRLQRDPARGRAAGCARCATSTASC